MPTSNTPATSAINALLAGPSAAERGHQITSAIPDGSKLLGLTIKNRLATIDLSSEFESGGGSASGSAANAGAVTSAARHMAIPFAVSRPWPPASNAASATTSTGQMKR